MFKNKLSEKISDNLNQVLTNTRNFIDSTNNFFSDKKVKNFKLKLKVYLDYFKIRKIRTFDNLELDLSLLLHTD